MLIIPLVASALALATPLDAYRDGATGSDERQRMVQAGDPPPPFEEGFEDDAPPRIPNADRLAPDEGADLEEPAPAEEPTVEEPPPPALSNVLAPDELEPERSPARERRGDRDGEASGMDPFLLGAVQVGTGVAVCTACGVGSMCVSCLLTPLAAIPFVGTLVGGVLCAGTGAAIGGAETLVGNLFGEEDVSFLWPVLAGAGVGAAYGVLSLGLGAATFALGGSIGETEIPGLPDNVSLPDLPTVGGVLGVVLTVLNVGLCVGTCVALPVVPAIVYALVSEPEDAPDDAIVLEEIEGPALARVSTAIAF